MHGLPALTASCVLVSADRQFWPNLTQSRRQQQATGMLVGKGGEFFCGVVYTWFKLRRGCGKRATHALAGLQGCAACSKGVDGVLVCAASMAFMLLCSSCARRHH